CFGDRLGSRGGLAIAVIRLFELPGLTFAFSPDPSLGRPEMLFAVIVGLEPNGALTAAVIAVIFMAAILTVSFVDDYVHDFPQVRIVIPQDFNRIRGRTAIKAHC